MNKIKEMIKRHKGLAIIGTLALILLIVIFIIFARMIFTSADSEYGDRLNGLVKIDKSITNKILEETESKDEVEKINIRTQGKIIYTTIYFTKSTNKDKAKEIANNTLTYYKENALKYYDFEYILTQKIESKEGEEDKSFTIIGTKHPDNNYISWTKN